VGIKGGQIRHKKTFEELPNKTDTNVFAAAADLL
jgi:hypothetical protein